MSFYFLSIDQGTTSSRAIIFDDNANVKAVAQQDFAQHFPHSGWVEHNADEIWQSTLSVCQNTLDKSQLSAKNIQAIGITNQRETTVLWHRKTGEVLYNAIVWQDRRTDDFCNTIRDKKTEEMINEKTGLLLDPYFSATKLCWLLDHIPNARKLAEQGELAFGTIDTFLLWRLTGGKVHKTDVTNAARTMLYNIHQQCWDDDLLNLFNIPNSLLPEVADNTHHFGNTEQSLLGHSIPITSMIGDQQSALVGQICFSPGSAKSTYGTGCFLVVNTGQTPIKSQHQLLTTIAYRHQGVTNYALEGSIFNAGTVVQWLRDQLGLIQSAKETKEIAEQVGYDTNGVYLVPAFTGLGAPHWRADVRGAIVGLNRDSNANDIVTAGLQSICLQTDDLLDAIALDGITTKKLRVDGGMVANDWFLQFLADILDIPIIRPQNTETTALGAAFLAAIGSGIYKDLNDIRKIWKEDKIFHPHLAKDKREKLVKGWHQAVASVLSK